MNRSRARHAQLAALVVWTLLVIVVASWPLTAAGIGPVINLLALLPLLLPMPGLVRGLRRTLQWSPLALSPALALTLTELVVNRAARASAALTLALILAAFAAVVAALRAGPRGQRT
jgi:uncharacterized membrane protein